MLTREIEPFDMESFVDYLKRLFDIRTRMVNYNCNNSITVGGTFNGFNVEVNNNSTIESIKSDWNRYWDKIK